MLKIAERSVKLLSILEKMDGVVGLLICVLLVFLIGAFDLYVGTVDHRLTLSALYLIPLIIGAWKFHPINFITLAVVISLFDNNEHIRNFIRPCDNPVELLTFEIILWWNIVMSLINSIIIGSFIKFLRDLLHKEMELSRIDGLTGILNKRGFIDALETEVSRHRRHHQVFAMAFIDVDNFKVVNDQYGHIVGDHALKMIAQTVKQHTRSIDVVCRFGGDEFVIMLPYADMVSAQISLSKIKSQLDSMVARHKWSISFSIGAVIFNSVPATVDEIINITDDIMYSVKKNGKNGINMREYTV